VLLPKVEGASTVAARARDLGFDGKTLIHPKTLALANAVFSPSAEEGEAARRIVSAHAEAIGAGKGIVVVEGRLIENLHVEEARLRGRPAPLACHGRGTRRLAGRSTRQRARASRSGRCAPIRSSRR
jgi:citrate lyase beta subunit